MKKIIVLVGLIASFFLIGKFASIFSNDAKAQVVAPAPAASQARPLNNPHVPAPKPEIVYPTESQSFKNTPYAWVDHYTLIAHALGGISVNTHSNSLDAFELNYKKGHRVFETDITTTTDNVLVLRHDWEPYLYNWFGQKVSAERMKQKLIPLSLAEFKSFTIYPERYKPLTFKEMVNLMKEHPDMYLITDTKQTETKLVKKQFESLVRDVKAVDPSLLDRIIVQIYDEKMLKTVRQYHNFQNIIYSLYLNQQPDRTVLSFAKRNGIKVIVMSAEYRYSEKFVKQLRDNGISSIINTVNDLGKYKQFMNAGVSGVMTDFIIPQDISGGNR